jgi:hypothetical protein
MTIRKASNLALGTVLAAFIITGVTPAHTYHKVEAKQSNQINALEKMLAWHQSYIAAYTELMSIYDSRSMAQLFATDINDIEATRAAFSKFNAEREVIIRKATTMFGAVEAPKRWNIQASLFDTRERAMFNAAVKQYEDIPSLLENIREGSDFLPMIKLLEAGQFDEAISGFVQKQLSANVQIVKAENKQIDGYLLALPKDHPNYQIQKIFKAFNLFGLEEIEWTRIELTEGADIEQRQIFADQMEKTIQNVPILIQRSKKNFDKTMKQLDKALSTKGLSSTDAAFIKRVKRATSSFKDSLVIEEKLYANAQSTLAAFRSDLIDEDFETKTEQIDLEFFDLVDSRVRLASERLALMQP